MSTDPVTAVWIYLLLLVPSSLLCGYLNEMIARRRTPERPDHRRVFAVAGAWGGMMGLMNVVVLEAMLKKVTNPALLLVAALLLMIVVFSTRALRRLRMEA